MAKKKPPVPQQLTIGDSSGKQRTLMYGLSMYPPWSLWVVDGSKPLENRDWFPPDEVIGNYIAVQCTKGSTKEFDAKARAISEATGVPMPDKKVIKPLRGCIIGVVRVDGYAVPSKFSDIPDTHPTKSPWWMGPYGWLLSNPRRLAVPIPYDGDRKLWRIPDEQRKVILAQLGDLP